jgi:predicted nucleotide-binding protein
MANGPETTSAAARIILLCDRMAPGASWTPGHMYFEASYRDGIEEILPLLDTVGARRYVGAHMAAYTGALRAIERTLARWRVGEPAQLDGAGQPNPLATIYTILVRGGARLPDGDAYGPVHLSVHENEILERLYQSVVDTGKWPLARVFETELSDAGVADRLRDAVAGIFPLVDGFDGHSHEKRTCLSLPGLALVPNAAADLAHVVAVVRAAGAVYRQLASAGKDVPDIKFPDVLAHLSSMPPDLHRLVELIRFEQPLHVSSPDLDPKTTYFGGGVEFLRLRKVSGVAELIRVLHPYGVFVFPSAGIGAGHEPTRRLLSDEGYTFMIENMTEDSRHLVEHVFDKEAASRFGDGFDPDDLEKDLQWEARRIEEAVSLAVELGQLTTLPLMKRGYRFANVKITETGRIAVRELRRTSSPAANRSASSASTVEAATEIFVVHGHDEGAQQSLARFLEKLGLTAVILSEQANRGQTIIEKFKEHADRVAFAVVLLTPDDVGGKQGGPMRPRARQNVILELGYFLAKLGSGRTCSLVKPGVENPSDYDGVLYIAMDDAGGWKLQLAREMKTAGLPVDLNRL